MNPEQLLAELQKHVDSLQETINSKREELLKVAQELDLCNIDKANITNALQSHRASVELERVKLEESITTLTRKNAQLIDENATLVQEKAALKQDNISLEAQNKTFKEYEGKAIKVLQAQEQSLIAREKALQQRESLRGNKSILPPRS